MRKTIGLLVLFISVLSQSTEAQQKDTTAINNLLNTWHRAAATANAQVFFSSMTEGSIYIGTDATERWTKSEFMAFAKPYFDRGSAWDFTPYNRDIHVTSDGKNAWFSELLTTWMEPAAGQGCFVKLRVSGKLNNTTSPLRFLTIKSKNLFN